MKYLIIALLLPLTTLAQYTKEVTQAKVIVEKRDISLNGGLNASVGGKSRVLVPVDLPSNTIEWYYSFTTSKGESGSENLKLAIQLTSLLVDRTRLTSSLVKKINVPDGSNSVDVYLLDEQNHIAFKRKEACLYIEEGTTENTKQALVQIVDEKTGKYYLGLKNPSTLNGLNISIEVVAIVKNKVYVDEWTSKSKDNIRNYCMSTFNTKENGRHDVCECAVEALVNDKKPSEWGKLTKSSQNSFIAAKKGSCFTETDNQNLLEAERKKESQLKKEEQFTSAVLDSIKDMYQQAQASSKLGDYKDATSKMLVVTQISERHPSVKMKDKNVRLGSCYNSMAWWALLENNIDDAGEYLKEALVLDANSMYIRANLGLYHLLNNNYNLAEEAFLFYKRREKFPNGDKWFKVVGNDLETLENRGITNNNFDKVRDLLRIR